MAWVSDTVFSLLVVLCGVFGTTTVAFGIAWIRARERAIRAEQHTALPADPEVAPYESVACAVATIAGEVEQLAEGQRFLTRVLTERAASDPSAGAHRAPVMSAP